MTIALHDSFLNAAQADLQPAKVGVKQDGQKEVWSATLSNDGSNGRFFVMVKLYHDE